MTKDRLAEINEVLDKIKSEILRYEADCKLSASDNLSCMRCTDDTFRSIEEIIDKYRGEEE